MRTMDLLLVTIVGNRTQAPPPVVAPTMTLSANDATTFSVTLEIYSDQEGTNVDNFLESDSGMLYFNVTNNHSTDIVFGLPQTATGLEFSSVWSDTSSGNFIAYPLIPAGQTQRYQIPYSVLGLEGTKVLFDFSTNPDSIEVNILGPQNTLTAFDGDVLKTFVGEYIIANDDSAPVLLESFDSSQLETTVGEDLRSM